MSEKYTFGEVRAIPTNAEESRTIEFVISNNTKDRHGTVLSVQNWQLDHFNANGIVGYQHNVYGGDLCNAPDPDQVIGKGRAWIEGDQLIGSVTFEPAEINPLAEKIFRKVLFGTLKATSVGFNPIGRGQFGINDEAENGINPTYYYAAQELLEFSIVNIPSNPDALKRSMRDQASNAINYIYRQLGGSYRFADIEAMTVGDVIQLLETRGGKPAEEPEQIIPENQPEPIIPDDSVSDEQRNLELETLNLEQFNRDNDMILIAQTKLALTANY